MIELLSLSDFERKCSPNCADYANINWLRAIDSALEYSVRVALRYHSTDRWLALPIFLRKMGPIKFCGAPLPGSFTGDYDIISSDDEVSLGTQIRFLSDLQLYFKEKGYSYIELPFLSLDHTVNSCRNDLLTKQIQGLVVDISNLDNTWKSFSGRARTAIKKAKSNNLSTKIVCKNSDNVEIMYAMLQQTFSQKGLRVPHKIKLFHALAELDFVKFLWVYKEDIVIAIGMFGFFDTKCVYLSGAMTAEGAKLNASSLLQWCAMQEGNRMGIDKYDLGGMGDPRVDKFKKSFSKNEYTRTRAIYTSKLWRILYPVAEFLRKKRIIQVN